MLDLSKYKTPTMQSSGKLDISKYKVTTEPRNFVEQTEQQYEQLGESVKGALGGGAIGTVAGGTVKAVGNIGIGAGKAALKTMQGLGQLGLGASNKVFGTNFDTKEQFFEQPKTLEAKGVAQNIGYGAEKLGEYLAPAGAVTKAQKIITGAVNLIPATGKVAKFAQGALGVAGRAIPEAVGTGAVSYLNTGGDTAQAVSDAKLAGGTSAVLGSFGSVYRGFKGDTKKIIDTGILKGIRPTVAGKNSAGQTKKYLDTARDAVSIISQNKQALKFDDGSGTLVSRLPQNLDEFSQAISDVKKTIFAKYDALAQGVGGAGRGAVVNLKTIQQSRVPLSSIADELDTISQNSVVQDNAGDVAKYASDRAKVFRSRGTYSPQEAQEAIKIYNDNLQAFYRNPSAELANKVSVDALIVNKMRKALDDTISGLQGSGYQELKKQYGSLSAIEKDVAHRALVEARKNAKGLLDYADMVSSADIIGGLVSGNPTSIIRGGVIQGVKGMIKNANSSDKHIERMFKAIEAPSVPANPALGRAFGGYGKKESAEALGRAKQPVIDVVNKIESTPNKQGGFLGSTPKQLNPIQRKELMLKKDEILKNLRLSESQKRKAIDAIDRQLGLIK